MITGRLEKLGRYVPAKYKTEILQWVESVNKDMKEGNYLIAGEEVYARVLSYRTKKETDCKIEAHDRYIDIQSVICGTEGIQVYEREALETEQAYDPQRDVTFYKKGQRPYLGVNVEEGCFAMLFPEEAHQPEISFQEDYPEIKKFVIKIKEELYE